MRRVLTNFYMLFTKTRRYSDHPATLFRAFHLIWINSWTLQKNMPTAPQFIFHTANNAPQPRELRPPQKKGVRKKGNSSKIPQWFRVSNREKRIWFWGSRHCQMNSSSRCGAKYGSSQYGLPPHNIIIMTFSFRCEFLGPFYLFLLSHFR